MCLLHRRTLLIFAALTISLAPKLYAQVMPITWSMQIPSGTVHQGKPFTALVRAQIPFSWHLYSTTQPSGGPMATIFTSNSAAFAMHGSVSAREPDRAFDAVAGMKTETYSDSVTFRVSVVAARAGKQTLEVNVKYQSCTDRFCAPQRNTLVRTTVTVAPSVKAQE